MRIITTHKNSDFDALASVIAASVLYPDAEIVLPDNLNPNVRDFMSLHKDLFVAKSPRDINCDDVTGLVVVDTSSWKRLDGFSCLKDRDDIDIEVWDHHPRGDIKADRMYWEEIGATISLLSRRLEETGKLITPIQATLFLLGLYEDTGHLSFKSTTPDDAKAAAYLLDRKADLGILGSFLHQAYGEKQKSVLYEMIKNSNRFKVNGFKVSINTLKVEGHVQNLSVVVGMYREILNVDAAFGIFHDTQRDRCMIIGRSRNEGLDMGSMMFGLGGGGHPGAGSAMLKKVNPVAVEEMIRDLLDGNHTSSVQLSDIMSYPVLTVKDDTPMKEVGEMLKVKGCTGLPVVNGDENLVGVISRRDFKKVKKQAQINSPVKAFMSRDVISIEPSRSPLEAVRLMIKKDIGRLPVVDEKKLIGIVTRSDAMIYFYDILPD